MKNKYLIIHQHASRILIAMVSFYFFLQLFQTYFQKIECDEFWFAYHIEQYLHKIPYLDFLPYKSVLGYYLFTPAFFFSGSVFNTLWLAKVESAVINTIALCLAGFWLARYYRPVLILFTFVILIFNESFLIYSSSLRPEMMIVWFGLFSFLLILENKIAWAGLLAGIGFVVSQKAAWYLIACNMAIISTLFLSGYFYKTLRNFIIYNSFIILIVSIYLLLWSMVASWQTLLDSFFYEAYLISRIDFYSSARYAAWQIVLAKVGFLFLLWPLMGLSLLILPLKNQVKRLPIVVFATVIMLFVFLYRQPFSYNLFFAFPAFFVVYPALFYWILYEAKEEAKYLNKRLLFYYITCHSVALLLVMIYFAIPGVAFLIVIVLATGGYLYGLKVQNIFYEKIFSKIILMGIFVAGMLYAWLAYIMTLPLIENSYQKYNLQLAHDMLETNEGYIAGTPFLYDREQPIHGIKNLISPAVSYLNSPSAKLAPLLNESLSMRPTTDKEVVRQLQAEPIKLYIDNYRLHLLPNSIRKYLQMHFRHYSGSIFLYAPIIEDGLRQVNIPFSGSYQVACDERLQRQCVISSPILLDDVSYAVGDVIHLSKGEHFSIANNNYSLYWIPVNIKTQDYSINQYFEMSKNVYM